MFRTSDDWNRIYGEEARPGWDLDGPTPLIDELLEEVTLAPGSRVAVPGCGFGHDAAELAKHGFTVTGLDVAPLAVEGARSRYGEGLTWRLQDWFTQRETFEAVFDHTCFVAMEPERRAAYAVATLRALEPGGLWLGVAFHNTDDRVGPPFAIPMTAMGDLIRSAGFELDILREASSSIHRRAGREFLWVARRR